MAIGGDALEIIDNAFRDLTIGDAPLQVHFDQCLWAEGPVWFGDGQFLVWSDIPNNRMLKFVPELGVTPFRMPSNFVNGNTRDLEGRLVSCSHGARAVLRTEWDGTVTTLVDSHQGKRLNSPNDVVVKSDGTIWFTDPSYGILSDYEGYKADQEQDGCFVYRFDPADGSLTVVADDFAKPNGLAFSADETTLYVSDTGQSHDPDWPAQIRQFSVNGKTLTNPKVFADIDSGLSDGFRLDTEGNIWTSAGLGVNVYNASGALLGRIKTGAKTSNVTFGGPNRDQLFITSSQYLLSINVRAKGLQRP
ncbi:MAG: SMP-30/gluconolactonase/LRE family protein [Candidatus Devosia phytovorans]|uniref:SMP-30/gluconolactonase/LRE family protein n=1 Tax=Candidatus Devosia phytovorans TaxID=3121372 RepID=A0AAJ5VVB2_9HYPH|nr:SMP-30/gluconolactonase/LRE family protein [Devosia sp.]WEK04756.1 MAG: SMP-30/gluconolactonase/LRE family protein [Devosia sp.]